MNDHPLVPPRSKAFICEGFNEDWSFRMPVSDGDPFAKFVSIHDADEDLRTYIAAMACFEWVHSSVSQFKFEEYGPFLEFLKTRGVDVMELDMWQRQDFGDEFKNGIYLQWAKWAQGEPFEELK